MSLFFLQPLYLFGLIAASIPALIHLLNRRRLKRIRFPAVRFILLSQRRISRAYRLRHWLLLALRTFAILLLALLLAHPIFQTGVGLLASGGPLSVAVVLDNSLSMKWARGGNGFQEAKDAARVLIASLQEGDRAAVVPTNNISHQDQIRLEGEKALLLRELDNVPLAAGTADFAAALGRAYELLKEPAAQKEIWLMTDAALTGWENFTLSAVGQRDPLIPLKVVKIADEKKPLNATVREVRTRGRGVGVGLPIDLQATVVNFGDQEIKDLLVQLNIDDRNSEQKLISLPAKGELEVSFVFEPRQAGDHRGNVTLKKEGLAGNPAFYFTLRAQERFRVLVVDGDPRTSLVQSETFFLTRALNPAGERDSSLFLPTVIIPDGLASVSLEPYQALILCNVATIPDAFLPRLREYLRKGGGLLVFLGDRVQADSYNARLFQSYPPLLPGRVGEKKILPQPAAQKIEGVQAAHPALQGFADPILKESLQSARVQGYFRTETVAGSPLLSLANGDPLLVEQRGGPGRILLFASAADRDWSDLPLKTAYLPLMQSLTGYLAGGARGMMDSGISAGGAKTFSFPPSYAGKTMRIIKPDLKEKDLTLVPDGNRATATFRENDLAGIYRLSLPAGESPDGPQIYPVNSPFFESRLEPIDERELKAKLGASRTDILTLDSLAQGGKRSDLSLPLLLLLIATLVSEGWLAQRF